MLKELKIRPAKFLRVLLQFLASIAFLALPLAFTSRGHRRLAAEYSVRKADISIPGITKVYEARIVNHGVVPVRIQVCDYVTDAGEKGSAARSSIERFDSQLGKWQPLLDLSLTPFCQPYPLRWSQAALRAKWLWPGQSVGTEEEATGARGYLKGASARFVVFDSSEAVQTREGFVTESFIIDEELGPGGEGLRLKH